MKYLSNDFKLLLLNAEDVEQSMKITTISKHEVKRKLCGIDGFESLIDDESSTNIISETLEMSITCRKISKDITPFDTLIIAQPKDVKNLGKIKGISIKFLMVELNANWKVDYYSRDRELIKEVVLGNQSYSEAKRDAFMEGIHIPYDVYDIYYI
jgi:hypothetical protein